MAGTSRGAPGTRKGARSSIEELAKSTLTPRVLEAASGEIPSLFQLDDPPGILRRNFKNPVLAAVSAQSGAERSATGPVRGPEAIGVDLVAVCANALLAQGAEPLFALPSIVAGKAARSRGIAMARGVALGCREAGFAMLGARMGGEVSPLAGEIPWAEVFAVGVVERARRIAGDQVAPGDQLIGLVSPGIPTSALARAVELLGSPNPPAEASKLLAQPSSIHVKPILSVLRKYRTKKVVHAMAHVAEHGLAGSVERVLPPSADAVIFRSRCKLSGGLRAIQEAGGRKDAELFRGLGMGYGFVLVVSRFFLESILGHLRSKRVAAAHLGEVVAGRGRARLAES